MCIAERLPTHCTVPKQSFIFGSYDQLLRYEARTHVLCISRISLLAWFAQACSFEVLWHRIFQEDYMAHAVSKCDLVHCR